MVKFLSFSVLVFLFSPARGQVLWEREKGRFQDEGKSPPALLEKQADGFLRLALEQKDSVSWSRFLDSRSTAQRKLGEFQKAQEGFFQALSFFNRKGIRASSAAVLNNLGTLYLDQGNFHKARQYLNSAQEKTPPENLELLAKIMANIGLCYDYEGKPAEAIRQYNLVIPLMKKTGNDHGLATLLHNSAICHQMTGDSKTSEKLELEALTIQRKTSRKDLLAQICLTLGSLYLDQGRFAEAAKFLEEGGRAAKELGDYGLLKGYYLTMVGLYKTRNEPAKALTFMEKFQLQEDSIHRLETAKAIADAEAKFQVSQKEKEIRLLSAENELAQTRLARTRAIQTGIATVAFLFLILAFVFWRNYQLKKQTNRMLAKEKERVEWENQQLELEKEDLIRENLLAQFETLKAQISPHFVFNSLNALVSLIRSEPEKAVEFTLAFSRLFRTTLEFKDKTLISLKEELEHARAYLFLQTVRFSENLRVSIEIDARHLNLLLPPLCLQMVLENAVKHNVISNERPLHIAIRVKDHAVEVVNDIQLRSGKPESTGTGLANIRSRYRILTDREPGFFSQGNAFVAILPLLGPES